MAYLIVLSKEYLAIIEWGWVGYEEAEGRLQTNLNSFHKGPAI